MALTAPFFRWVKFAQREHLILVLFHFGAWMALLTLWPQTNGGQFSDAVLFSATTSLVLLQCIAPGNSLIRLRTLPGWSEFVTLLLSVPVAGLLSYAALHLLFSFSFTGISARDIRLILLVSPGLATAAFLLETIVESILLLFGVRRTVVLDLLPEEEQAFRHVLKRAGLNADLTLVSKRELSKIEENEFREIDFLVISKHTAQKFDKQADLIRAHLSGVPVLDSCQICASLSKKISLPLTDQWAFLQGAVPQTFSIRAYREIKTLIEPMLALLLLLLFAPLFLLVTLMIWATSRGPAFYHQERLGFRGVPFTLIKFRTMYVDAEAQGPKWAKEKDPRITPLGKILRRTRIDELPQLINVVRGEMSFVGPRPERPEIYRALEQEIPLFSLRLIVRPGITGWAQVVAGYAATVQESHQKLEYDLYYIQNMTPLFDFVIAMRTLSTALFGDHRKAYFRGWVRNRRLRMARSLREISAQSSSRGDVVDV